MKTQKDNTKKLLAQAERYTAKALTYESKAEWNKRMALKTLMTTLPQLEGYPNEQTNIQTK